MVAEISAELVDTGVFLSKWGRLVTHVWFNVAPRVEESWEKYWLLKLYCHSNHRFFWLVIDFVQVRVSWDDYVHFFSLICSQQPDSMIQYHGNVRQANIKLSNTDKYWWERVEIERGFQTIETDNPPDLIRLETCSHLSQNSQTE